MTIDEQFTAALRAAVSKEPPPYRTPTEVFELANTLRRRDRVRQGMGLLSMLIVAGGLVAGGLVAGGAVWLGPEAPPLPGAVAPSSMASPSARQAAVRMSPEAMLAALRNLLPSGITAQVTVSSPGAIAVTLTDAHGSTSMMLNVATLDPEVKSGSGASSDLYNCATRSMPRGTACVAETDSIGRVITLTGPTDATSPPGVLSRTVDLLRTDGIRVVVTEANAIDGKSGPQTRSAPMLSLAQLRAIASSPAFAFVAAAASPAGAAAGGASQ